MEPRTQSEPVEKRALVLLHVPATSAAPRYDNAPYRQRGSQWDKGALGVDRRRLREGTMDPVSRTWLPACDSIQVLHIHILQASGARSKSAWEPGTWNWNLSEQKPRYLVGRGAWREAHRNSSSSRATWQGQHGLVGFTRTVPRPAMGDGRSPCRFPDPHEQKAAVPHREYYLRLPNFAQTPLKLRQLLG
jgi:hypothetical protein